MAVYYNNAPGAIYQASLPKPAIRIDTTMYDGQPPTYRPPSYTNDPGYTIKAKPTAAANDPLCTPRCMAISAIVVIVLTVVAVILGVFFGTGGLGRIGHDNNRTTTAPAPTGTGTGTESTVPAITTTTIATTTTAYQRPSDDVLLDGAVPLHGQLRLENFVFIDSLMDRDSPLFVAYEKAICETMIATLTADEFNTLYCAIPSMRTGSIIAEYNLQIEKKDGLTDEATAAQALAAINKLQEESSEYEGPASESDLYVDYCIFVEESSRPCDHVCLSDPDEPDVECGCFSGYYLGTNGTCLDIDECEEGTAGCSDMCENKEEGFMCSCPDGSVLHVDGLRCFEITITIPDEAPDVPHGNDFTTYCRVTADPEIVGELKVGWYNPSLEHIGSDITQRMSVLLGSSGDGPYATLTIRDLLMSDIGTFYCGARYEGQPVLKPMDMKVTPCPDGVDNCAFLDEGEWQTCLSAMDPSLAELTKNECFDEVCTGSDACPDTTCTEEPKACSFARDLNDKCVSDHEVCAISEQRCCCTDYTELCGFAP